jgi:hypothetical protein
MHGDHENQRLHEQRLKFVNMLLHYYSLNNDLNNEFH